MSVFQEVEMFNKLSAYIFICVFSSLIFAQDRVPASTSKSNPETQKKVEPVKPPALPQAPVVAKEKSDAADEGLKGKVKQNPAAENSRT